MDISTLTIPHQCGLRLCYFCPIETAICEFFLGMVTRGTNERMTQLQIAKIARVTEATLRSHARQIKSYIPAYF